MRFIFQQSCGPHTLFPSILQCFDPIGQKKKKKKKKKKQTSTEDMIPSHELFSPLLYGLS